MSMVQEITASLAECMLPPNRRQHIADMLTSSFGKDGATSITLALPQRASQTLSEVAPLDKRILHELIEGNAYPLSEQDCQEIVSALQPLGVLVTEIAGNTTAATLKIAHPLEDIDAPTFKNQLIEISQLLNRFHIEHATIACLEPEPPQCIYNHRHLVGTNPTRGSIELGMATVKTLLPRAEIFYDDEQEKIIIIADRQSTVMNMVLEHDAFKAIPLAMSVYIRHPRELPDTADTVPAYLKKIYEIKETYPSLAGLPIPITAEILKHTDDAGVCRINPDHLLNALYDQTDTFRRRTDPASLRENPQEFWGTGSATSLHDDGWCLRIDDASGNLIVSLARPDPSFIVPEGGLLHTAACFIERAWYQYAQALVPMLPLTRLAHTQLSLKVDQYRPALVTTITITQDGTIATVDMSSELVRLHQTYAPTQKLFEDPHLLERLREIGTQRHKHIPSKVVYDNIIPILSNIASEATALFAQEHHRPAIYIERHPLLPKVHRLRRISMHKETLGDELFEEIYQRMNDDDALSSFIKTLSGIQREKAHYCCCQEHRYSHKPIAPGTCQQQATAGPPLRDARSLSLVLSLSRWLRGRPHHERLMGNQEPSKTLQHLLLTGAYQGISIFDDTRFTISEQEKLRLLGVPHASELSIKNFDEGTIIDGYDINAGKVVLRAQKV